MYRLGLFCWLLLCCSCKSQIAEKINGVSFVADREPAEQQHVDPVLAVNANYAAVMPFGFIKSLSAPNVVFDSDRQWYGETKEGATQYIALLQKNGVRVMLKPQIWVWRGEFTGDIQMTSEADWKTLERTYTDFILTYARVAEASKVAVFCIGTELEEFVEARPGYWQSLIKQVKRIYSGKLTYASNWDEYPKTSFWDSLDYIGVDGYFPLSNERYPTKAEFKSGWQKWKVQLQEISQKYDRPILFTEFGYRSMDYTGKKPWLVDRNQTAVNLGAQADALEVLFNELWVEDWFAGGFVWKWFINHDKSGGAKDNRFTPQNKPAEEVIRKQYGLRR
ncbi:MAG: glycoside hydrolase [Bacteroidota bacterium]